MHEQVMTLIMASHGAFDSIPTKDVKKHQSELLDYLDLKHPEIGRKIEETKAIDDTIVNQIMDAVKEFAE